MGMNSGGYEFAFYPHFTAFAQPCTDQTMCGKCLQTAGCVWCNLTVSFYSGGLSSSSFCDFIHIHAGFRSVGVWGKL